MTESAKFLDVRKIVKIYRGFTIFIKFENCSKPLCYCAGICITGGTRWPSLRRMKEIHTTPTPLHPLLLDVAINPSISALVEDVSMKLSYRKL